VDLWHLSAESISSLVKSGDISAREVAQSHLDRLAEVNPQINAVVDICEKDALAAADIVDAKRGKGEPLGILAGVPVTIKVNIDQKGYATTNGLRIQKELIAQEDNPVVTNFHRADAVIIGRTNTPAFSLRWFTRNSLHGHTKNPLNSAITPGGSSGGGAAAVAAGIGAIAHGTDIAGSIRYPAYACGIHGLRPSLGRVSAHNFSGPDRFIGGQLMAVSGPMARTVGDLKLALEALSVHDHRDPWSVAMPYKGKAYSKKIAFCDAPENLKVDPRIKIALREAAGRLEEFGWQVEEVSLPPLRSAMKNQLKLWMAEMEQAAASLVEQEADPDATLVYSRLLKLASPLDNNGIMRVLQERASLTRQWRQFLSDYPLLLCPVSCSLPFDDLSDLRTEKEFEQIIEDQILQIGLPFMGLPGLTVTLDRKFDRPVGVQLVASHFREDILLSAAECIAQPMPVTR